MTTQINLGDEGFLAIPAFEPVDDGLLLAGREYMYCWIRGFYIRRDLPRRLLPRQLLPRRRLAFRADVEMAVQIALLRIRFSAISAFEAGDFGAAATRRRHCLVGLDADERLELEPRLAAHLHMTREGTLILERLAAVRALAVATGANVGVSAELDLLRKGFAAMGALEAVAADGGDVVVGAHRHVLQAVDLVRKRHPAIAAVEATQAVHVLPSVSRRRRRRNL